MKPLILKRKSNLKILIAISISDFGRLYRTGDFGVLQKGVILYAGRTDSQIKIRGHRVDLQEVDRAVAAVDGVDKCEYLMEAKRTEQFECLTTTRQKSRLDPSLEVLSTLRNTSPL